MEPTIFCPLHVECVTDLPSPFTPLSSDEKKEEWGKELMYGNAFAKEWDLYRAITCYKRGLFLIPDCAIQRKHQLEYGIILSYYLGNKYQDSLNQFEKGSLSHAGPDFPAF
ncbi:MAG: tetratricopeptide repeat protein, partial [Parachlamydiaceae bacterium]|nr:tetratricopeptide repeat protein [Parachlamydiaceae bacterium]